MTQEKGQAGEDVGWQAQKSAMTRERILAAVVDCFITEGYTHVTTAKVAKSAGVSRGAMLHHFPSKTELIGATVEYLHDKLLEDFYRRAWTKPVIEGVDPLPIIAFTRFEDWKNFVIRHEIFHSFLAKPG